MTAQISDNILYSNNEYSIAAIEKEWPFDPQNYGFQPKPTHTACYRGYYCEYSILGEHLVLSKLRIGLDESKKPTFIGVEAQKSKYFKFDGFCEYSDVNLPIEYTGGIVIGRDFLQEFYIHMGFHRPHCYRYVLELLISKGKLVEFIDHSKRMEEVREMVRMKKQSNDKLSLSDKEIKQFIEESFSLSYKKKWY